MKREVGELNEFNGMGLGIRGYKIVRNKGWWPALDVTDFRFDSESGKQGLDIFLAIKDLERKDPKDLPPNQVRMLKAIKWRGFWGISTIRVIGKKAAADFEEWLVNNELGEYPVPEQLEGYTQARS